MKQIQLSVPDGKRVEWQEVDGKTIAVLVDEEVKDDRPVTERIKTFEDACVATKQLEICLPTMKATETTFYVKRCWLA